MSLKAKLEAIIYATEEPVTLNELASLLKDAVLADMQADEQARLARNLTVSDGPPPPEEDDEEETFAVEEAAAEIAGEPGMTVELPAPEAHQAEPPTPEATEEDKKAEEKEQLKAIRAHLARVLDELVNDYASAERGMEIRQIAGGYRMATKPEHHDVVVSFAKSLKPPVRLSLQALETLAVIAYKQPITVPEISEIRGVDSAGVIATLLDRKLVTTGGRKQVIGRPILYKTTKEFLLRFGLRDIGELPSMEEFEKLGDPQAELFTPATDETAPSQSVDTQESPTAEAEPVTEAVPEQNGDTPLMGETDVPTDGVRESEAEAVMAANPNGGISEEPQPGEGDTSEPVTEAVPEASGEHSLVGERTVSDEGTFVTEGEPEAPSEKS
jgi:segregation and condensation protein B